MRERKFFALGTYILLDPPGRKYLTKRHREILDAVEIPKKKGGHKRRPESQRQLVLTTLEMARDAGHPLTFIRTKMKNGQNIETAFELTARLTGVTIEAVRNIYKTRMISARLRD